MRKFFAFISLLIFAVLAVIFFVCLNIKLTSSPDAMKAAAQKSGMYDTVSAYIKDKIVQENNINLDQGNSFERLNEEVSSNAVKSFVDGTIDRVFIALNSKNPEDLNFNISFQNVNLGYELPKDIQLSDNLFVIIYQKAWSIIAIFGLAAAIFLVFAITMLKDIRARLNWVGISFIFIAIISLGGFVGVRLLEPSHLEYIARQSLLADDTKLLNGLARFFVYLVSKQSVYYFVEFCSFTIFACALWFASGALKREVIDKIDSLFFESRK